MLNSKKINVYSHNTMKQNLESIFKVKKDFVADYYENNIFSFVKFEKKKKILSSQYSHGCTYCGSTITDPVSLKVHPLWNEPFCRKCQKLSRCILCEKRCVEKPFFLNEEKKIGLFRKLKVNQGKSEVPLYICNECNASGIVTREEDLIRCLNKVLDFYLENPRLNIQFVTEKDFSNANSSLTKYSVTKHLKECSEKSTDIVKLSGSIPINVVNIQFLTRPLAKVTHSIKVKASNHRTVPNGWGENLVFGRCDFVENTKSTSMKSLNPIEFNEKRLIKVSNDLKNELIPRDSVFTRKIDYDSLSNEIKLKLCINEKLSSFYHKNHGKPLNKPKCYCFKGVHVVSGLSEDTFLGTLAHELMHTVIFLYGFKLPFHVEEGFCNAMYMSYLQKQLINYNQLLYSIEKLMKECQMSEQQNISSTKYSQQSFETIFADIFPNEYKDYIQVNNSSNNDISLDIGKKETNDQLLFRPKELSNLVILELIRERIILRYRILSFRLNRMLMSDTEEYFCASLIYPYLTKFDYYDILSRLHNYFN